MLDDVLRRRRTYMAALGVSSVAMLAPSAGPLAGGDAEASSCAAAKARISKAPPRKLRSALLCLVNRKRSAEGLKALRLDRKLQKAAGRHARDMVRHDYFAHQRPGGPDLTERLDRAGWHGTHWGETIAYGCGRSSTPKATLRGWLNSPPHRQILLSATYKRGGIGLGAEAPCGGGGATWVLDVGRR
jgi:uncharacterized protein YkwD